MGAWISLALTVIISLLKFFTPEKKTAEETLIEEREETIRKMRNAKDVKSKLVSDSNYAGRVREKYTRKDE